MIFHQKIKLERIKLDLQKFRGIFSNLTIVQLSDLHISKFGFREKKLIHLINREQADIILITGDLLVNYENDFSGCLEYESERLRQRLTPIGVGVPADGLLTGEPGRPA